MSGPRFLSPQAPQYFASTRGGSSPVPLVDAVLEGLARDGGLYVPTTIEPFSRSEIAELLCADYATIASLVLERLLGREIEREALRKFFAEELGFDFPLVEVATDLYCLELFHGPTLAFKDVGARFMAFLMGWARQQRRTDRQEGRTVTILAATSGDTGSAVAHAFWRRTGFRVVVLFPRGQVSEAQRRLFSTLGHNTSAFAVEGSFDDCQRLVKAAFSDHELRERLPLASANSINVARWLPQTVYYFTAVAQLRRRNSSLNEDPEPGVNAPNLFISVPCGNFGNLTAGLLAKRLGLPVTRFTAATNSNDVVPEFLETGRYRPRPSVSTPSNAMDVGDPSNFERLLWLYGEDVDRLRKDVQSVVVSDDQTLAAMRDLHQRHGRLVDPHSAVAILGAQEALRAAALSAAGSAPNSPRNNGPQRGEPQNQAIAIATAHPAKFEETVRRATGTAIARPPEISRAFARPENIVDISADYGSLRTKLLAG